MCKPPAPFGRQCGPSRIPHVDPHFCAGTWHPAGQLSSLHTVARGSRAHTRGAVLQTPKPDPVCSGKCQHCLWATLSRGVPRHGVGTVSPPTLQPDPTSPRHKFIPSCLGSCSHAHTHAPQPSPQVGCHSCFHRRPRLLQEASRGECWAGAHRGLPASPLGQGAWLCT